MLIDSHCHLDFPDFAAELDAVVARGRAAGIERMVTISTRVARQPELLAIAERFPDVFCSVGTHPHYAHEELDVTTADLVAATRHPKVVALGEAGLDYHYDNSPREAQERGFRSHIAAARETGLPLVIHSREADDDTARILEEESGKGAFPAVLHCFTGGRDLARRAVALGHFVSFTGILTFKNSAALRAIAAELPADRILVETDAPYLAPGKYRGKRNEPAFVVETAKVLAETRGVSFDEIRAPDHGKLLPLVQQSAAIRRRRQIYAVCANKIFGRIIPKRLSSMTLKFTILGCGSSGGVPRPALGWGDCDPKNPKNRRRRTSLLVERSAADGSGATRVLVDTPPDLREQMLDADVDSLDGVLYTHEHADHTHGIDDLRAFFLKQRRRVDVYLDEPTAASLHVKFGYCFKSPPGSDYPPIVTERRLTAGTPVTIEGQGGPVVALPFRQEHGDIDSLGFRFGKLAYSADLSGLPPESVAALVDLDVWIVDALRYRPHPSHFSLDDALSWIERLKPRRAILTNLHADLDYEVLRGKLPVHVVPAFDGMTFAVSETP